MTFDGIMLVVFMVFVTFFFIFVLMKK